MKRSYFILFLCFLLCTACAVGPDYEPHTPDIKDAYISPQNNVSSNENVRPDWWGVFDDDLLANIIDEAIRHNHDVKIATANVNKAKALRKKSFGSLWPRLLAGQDSVKEKFSSKVANVSAGERDVFSSQLDASWEIDLFGKNRRTYEAAKANWQASEENKNAVLLSVIAEVARTYFEIRGAQRRISILEENIAILQQVQSISHKQFKAGLVAQLDTSQSTGEYEEALAKMPDLQSDLQSSIYRLSVLAGKPPEHYLDQLSKHHELPPVPDIIPIGLKSDILQRRPDLRLAERQVASATAQIGVQTAKLFPTISLTGVAGTSAGLFTDMFGAGAGTFTAGSLVKWSLFEAGAIRARIAQADAEAKAALLAYEQKVLQALENVETSLLRYGNEWAKLKKLQRAQQTRQTGFDMAKKRYELGDASFLIILDAQRSLVAIKEEVVLSEIKILTSLTQLYKALGGGWEVFVSANR